MKKQKGIFILYHEMLKNAFSYSVGLIALRMLAIAFPLIRVLLISAIIVNVQAVLTDSVAYDEVALSVVLLLSLECLSGIVSALSQATARKCGLHLTLKCNPKLLRRIAGLEAWCFEDDETLDLIMRVKNRFSARIVSAFSTSLFFAETIITALALMIILSTFVGVWSLLPFIFTIPLIMAGQKSGKDQYTNEVMLEKHQRYLTYLEDLFTGRETANERRLFNYRNLVIDNWHKLFNLSSKFNRKVKFDSYPKSLIKRTQLN